MRVRLKGLNSRRKKLADGTWKTYWYAWKGGPPIAGAPGTTEFMASYNAAVAAKVVETGSTLRVIIAKFESSAEFAGLAARTQADYAKWLTIISGRFGTMPIQLLKHRRARAVFSEWKDELARRSPRQADYAWSIFARCLSWAWGRGLVEANPLKGGGRLYRNSRSENVWSDEDERRFMQVASLQLRLAFQLAVWTAQRQGDLLRLPWSSYDGEKIRLRQRKTKRYVTIPVGSDLKRLLDVQERRCPIILTQRNGKPWTEDGFRSSWAKACAAAGIENLTFNDLRGTCVTRLAVAGCSEAEIATLTGHSLRDVKSILDAHYLARDPLLAEAAIKKLEQRRTKLPD
ncbi:MAG: tyrosine-type recombinase/integrase [Hyphomicrobiales bacterium]